MSNNAERGGMRSPVKWLSAWLPVLFGIAVLCVESTPELGADRTSGPLLTFYEAVFGHVNRFVWGEIHHYIRKSGHFLGYGMISLLLYRALAMTAPLRGRLAAVGLAMLGTLCLASLDEWHQSFLPNRSASPLDVLLDCSGALVLQLLVWLISGRRELRPAQPA